VDILYSNQLYGVAVPKMPAPVTTEPAAVAVEPDDGMLPAVVTAGVFPESPDFVDVVWVEHPETATAITTSTIVMILIPEIFKLIPPYIMKIPDTSPAMRESECQNYVGILYKILLKNFDNTS
jgi:hypothetical protein